MIKFCNGVQTIINSFSFVIKLKQSIKLNSLNLVCVCVLYVFTDTPGADGATAGASSLMCPCCRRMFIKSSGLATHIKSAHVDFYANHFADDSPIRANQRSSFTNDQKARVLDRYVELLNDPVCRFPYKECTKWAFGAVWEKRKGYLNRWLRACGEVRQRVLGKGLAGKKARRNGQRRKVQFPSCEDELYIRFLFRRTALGYPVNHYWLMTEFRKILDEAGPSGYNGQKFTVGWTVQFCRRYSITTQAKNNIKAQDQVDRMKAIQNFHRYLILSLQHSEPQTDLKYGRFAPARMFHVDQVPLPFASAHGTTLNPKGAKSCRIAGVRTSGLEKRQATLQLWICAEEGSQVIKPSLIFRGSRGKRSKLPWPAEKVVYERLDKIRVAFQPNAWADEQFCEEEIMHVASDLHVAGVIGEVMIGMDNHVSQRTPKMLSLYSDLGMVPVFTAANCTDCISPVDHHIGRYIQSHMGNSYRTAVEQSPDIWIAQSDDVEIEDTNCTSAMARRMLMAQWLSDAWVELTTNHSNMINTAFVKTGFKLAKDGSEDHLIEIQGWSDPKTYSYRE